MSTDFRSLLSSFQSATDDTKKKVPRSGIAKNGSKKKPMKELTTSLWERSQLRQSVQSLQRPTLSKFATTTTTTTTTPAAANHKRPIHLAVCLCVVDTVTHEQVWREWMQGADTDAPIQQMDEERNVHTAVSAEIYVHAKTPEKIRTAWAKSKLIDITHRPNWNDVRVVQAMLSLLKAALKDDRTTHILFGTESCLPIAPLSQLHLVPGKSYVSYYGKDQASRFDERDVWDALGQNIPLDAIHKALPGWCTLARDHAQAILDLPPNELEGQDLWSVFESCWAPEEAFFPTALALLGLLPDTERKSLTYAEWDERAKRPQDKAHPKTWDNELTRELVSSLRHNHGTVILRKVKYPVPIALWREIVSGEALKRSAELHANEVSEENVAKRPKLELRVDNEAVAKDG